MRAGGSSPRARSERARRRGKNARGASSKTPRWTRWAIGVGAALSGFIAVLWLTEPVTTPYAPTIAALANATVSDATSLMAAVQTAGLHGTTDVKGAIDEIKRLDNDRVAVKGRVTDISASGSALNIVAFAGGKHVLTTVTEGAGIDIARMLGSADTSAKEMSFQGVFACRSGERIVVIAVTSGAAYSQFRSLACP